MRATLSRRLPAKSLSGAVLMERLSRTLLILQTILFVVLCAPIPRAWAAESHVLVLGRISDDPTAHYAQLKPLLDYVVPRMADVGIREGRVLMARDPQQMASYIRRGRVDWVTETAGTGMLLSERGGAIPLLLTERGGRDHYHTVFFTRRDSPIVDMDGLRGHRIAFQRSSSTSAYFVPASELLERGLQLEILLSPEDSVDSDALGYLFARSELNVATWVHKGVADVGVMSNLDWENPARMPEVFKRDMVVIGRTDEFPRALELVRSDLAPKVQSRLREVLMEAASDPDASEALRRFFDTTGFLPMDDDSRRALERVQARVRRVRSAVE